MSDYRVKLDIFAGPLDLLLYLVRTEEVDIYDIPIAKVTEQYIHYVEMLKSLDIDLAGDFLVMAASLMQIKSAMLLPQAETESPDAEDLADPRAELVRQLLEYKKYKDAANILDGAAKEQAKRFSRPATITEKLNPETEPEIDIDRVGIWDLLEAFDSICKATGADVDISRIKDETPIDLYQIEILHRLQNEGHVRFERIFQSKPNRAVMIGLFLALLELIREDLISAEQSGSSSRLYLKALTSENPKQAVRKAIIAVSEQEQNQHSGRRAGSRIEISELPSQGSSKSAGSGRATKTDSISVRQKSL